jgi:hypothetical protein
MISWKGLRRHDSKSAFFGLRAGGISICRFYTADQKTGKKQLIRANANFNKPLILQGKSKMANDSKPPFSNYKSAALNQLSYAGVRYTKAVFSELIKSSS